MSDILLSDEQEKIVSSSAKNIIVAAGAGSGKTRVLTERVKRLLEKSVDPRGIVVITFTNLAASELHDRLNGVPNAERCFIGTIHSLASALLSTKYDFEIFNEQIQDTYIKFLLNHYARYATYDDYDTLMDAFRQLQSNLCKYDDIVRVFKPKVLDELLILLGYDQQHNLLDYKDYPQTVITMCKVNHVITFDELIEKCTEYFQYHNTHINYLFVDELQDIGYLEYDFLMKLEAANNFFIGDDYQAIYKFKGGDVGIFLSLLKNPDWSPYYLEDNYRNGSIILNFANGVINKASDIIHKNSICKSGRIGSVDIKRKSQFVSFLSTFTDGSITNYGDWFILTRSNRELNEVSEILKGQKIPYVTFKKSELTSEEKDILMSKNVIKVLTVHTSKGSESENVILYGHFPLNPTSRTKSEEIKVLYVGITRTKEKLIIFNE